MTKGGMEIKMITFLSLISGSSGNATFVSDGKTKLLIDCGMSGSRLKTALENIDVNISDLDAVLITHEHSDHIKGLGVIARKYQIPVFATFKTFSGMKNIGEFDDSLKNCISDELEIGGIGIRAFSIPHDAEDPVGYNFFIDNTKLSLATDIGFMNENVFSSIQGSKYVILESNHDVDILRLGSYPYQLKKRILGTKGHLSNDDAAKTALKLAKTGTEHFMLAHLSRENNLPEIAEITTSNIFKQNNIRLNRDVTLTVASRYEPTMFGAI